MDFNNTTNHIFYTGYIYCRKLNQKLLFTAEHMRDNCQDCPFFVGTAQGEGIECLFYDGSEAPIDIIKVPTQVEQLRKDMVKIIAAQQKQDNSGI